MKLRTRIKLTLQQLLGFENYQFYASRFNISNLRSSKVEADFVHFLDLLPAGKLILDVGANFGVMTVALAKKAEKVYSFEPIPENARVVKRLLKYYNLKNVTLFECAVGNQSGELKMVVPIIDNDKISGLSHVVDDNNQDEGEFFTVPVKRLDDIPELQQADSIGAIKMDVENFEFEALTGAKALLLKHKPIIFCEIWKTEKSKLTLDFLKNEIGYTIKVIEGGQLVPFTNQDALNYFMIPY